MCGIGIPRKHRLTKQTTCENVAHISGVSMSTTYEGSNTWLFEAPDPLTRRCARRRGENASAEVGILFPIGWLCHLNGDADTRRADDVEAGGATREPQAAHTP